MKKETQNLKEQNKVPFFLKDYPNICREFQGEIQWNRTMWQAKIAMFLILSLLFFYILVMELTSEGKDSMSIGISIFLQIVLAAMFLGPDMVKICKCLFMKERLVQLETYLGGEKEEISWGWKHTYVTEDSHLIFCSHIIPLEGLTKILYYHLHDYGRYRRPYVFLDTWLVFCYEDGKKISVQEERVQPRHFEEYFDYAKLKAAISNEKRDVKIQQDKSKSRTILRIVVLRYLS
ncbi:MAG: hypothetical protein J1E61_01250 [Lachnospiraceae bacterium]|nr:hypothetical protein [Lachnospiraceae bacterium]